MMAWLDPASVLTVAAWASLLSNIWLGWACSHGTHRLLKRQLFHQAVATLVFISVGILEIVAFETGGVYDICPIDRRQRAAHTRREIPWEASVCRVVAHSLFFVSCLAELHIAASIAAASRRRTRELQLLGVWLPAIWPLAAVYGITGAASVVDGQVMLRDVSQYDPLGASIVLACFVLTLVLYSLALQVSIMSNSPDVVLTRMRRRAMVYPTIFVVTGLPTCARYFELFTRCSSYGQWSLIAETATGALNALAFAVLNREPSSQVPAPVSLDLSAVKAPKVVGFSATAEVQHIPTGGSFRKADQWQSSNGAIDVELAHIRQESSARPGEESAEIWRSYVGGG